jgi:hypothetical protein
VEDLVEQMRQRRLQSGRARSGESGAKLFS